MTEHEHDELEPVSGRTLAIVIGLSALASAALFYLMWREEITGALSNVRAGRPLVSVRDEPGRMMADVNEALDNAAAE